MRKIFEIVIIITEIVLLASCTVTESKDINEFLNKVNNTGNINLNSQQFTITKDDDYKYTYMFDKSNLISIFANNAGIVKQISITTDQKNNKNYNKISKVMCMVFMTISESDAKKAIKKAEYNGTYTIENYKIIIIENELSETLIVNSIDDSINTNTNPTLKEYIHQDDISRPIISTNSESTSKYYY